MKCNKNASRRRTECRRIVSTFLLQRRGHMLYFAAAAAAAARSGKYSVKYEVSDNELPAVARDMICLRRFMAARAAASVTFYGNSIRRNRGLMIAPGKVARIPIGQGQFSVYLGL